MEYTSEGKPIITFGNFEFILTSQDPKNVKAGKYDNIFVRYFAEEKPEIVDTEEKPKTRGRKKKVGGLKSHIKKQTEIVDIDLTGIPTNFMSVKNRNKIKKILKKYTKDGFIMKSDATKIQKDLENIKLDESDILERLNMLVGQ